MAALLSLVLLTPGFAHDGEDHDDGHDNEFNINTFKIQSFGIDIDGNPYLMVKDMAGTSVPDEHGVKNAYMFATDVGT